jgi:hypothetical protein
MRARIHCALLSAGVLMLATLPVLAQDSASGPPLTPEESALLGNTLVFDPAMLATTPGKPLHIPGSNANGFDVTRTQKPDGSTSVVVKQPLPTEWTNTVGADLPASNSALSSELDHPLPTARNDFGSGATWASVGVPYVGSVDARVDPANEQGKIGTTLKQSIPFGQRFALTVQDTYSVTDTVGRPSPGPADMPLMALPPSTPTSPQVFGNERAVKFNILPTGTTLGAGLATASNDPTTHNTFSADQRLYGPLHVTTAVSDLGQTTSSKSITAGFKLHW